LAVLDTVLKRLLPATRLIDSMNRWIGRHVAWLIIVAVVVSTVNATVRKVLDTSSNAWLELQWILFSMVFLLCSPWTLLSNEHIRIDIVNQFLSKHVRNWIDVIGHVFFLLPLTIVMLATSVPFFLASYNQNEQSLNAGGLPQWPSKGLIVIAFALLFLQGLSELIKRIAVMRNLILDPHATHSSMAAEAEELISATDKR